MKIFLARQAIYDKRGNVTAYELLFRNSKENYFSSNVDEDKATMTLIANCETIGFGKLTNNKLAFINFSTGVLLKDVISLLSPENVVIEILENVKPNEEILEYLRQLKKKKYILSLDDVIDRERCIQFGNLIDIYKIDFRSTDRIIRRSILKNIKDINADAEFLAEKIENEDEYNEALEDGYSYFQGYHFSRPVIITEKDIPVKKINCIKAMTELLKPDFNMDIIENIIKSDLAISYKLMKFLNSSKFGFVQEITSIRQAMMMLGKDKLRKWMTLIAISHMQNNNEEAADRNIIRARLCELIALEIAEEKSSNAFITGLFSNLDSFINKDMKDILDEIPLSEEVKRALLGADNVLGNILKLVYAYENADAYQVIKLCEKLRVDRKLLGNLDMGTINCLEEFIN